MLSLQVDPYLQYKNKLYPISSFRVQDSQE